ncbi:MAG TPA: carboxymuconolactone decarboxylase family protein, partial [Actinomycetota bacterium]|nr:carboxymuconolactone decarboxylase family protein [Actinomycetota bacterium]
MRIPPVTARDHLDDEGRAAFDRIVETRGEILRPFQTFLHSPAVARSVAELGHVVRFRSHLGDRDRELVTVATGRARACPFIWESHLDAARRAGLREESIQALVSGGEGLERRERLLTTFVSELCETG